MLCRAVPSRSFGFLSFAFRFRSKLVKAGVYVYQDAKDAARGRVLQHVEIAIATTPANQSHCFSSTGSTKRARDCSSSSEGGENYEVEEAGPAFYRPLFQKNSALHRRQDTLFDSPHPTFSVELENMLDEAIQAQSNFIRALLHKRLFFPPVRAITPPPRLSAIYQT